MLAAVLCVLLGEIVIPAVVTCVRVWGCVGATGVHRTRLRQRAAEIYAAKERGDEHCTPQARTHSAAAMIRVHLPQPEGVLGISRV